MSFRDPNEDLFEDSKMSFGEHLEELRIVLIRSVIGIVVGCVIGFLFAEKVVKFLQRPLEDALTKYYVKAGKGELREENGYLAPELNTLFDRGLIPETVLIDPGQLVTALRSVSGDFLENVSLEPYRFRADQIAIDQLAALCSDWAAADEKATESDRQRQKQLLWSLLDDEQRNGLQRIATSQNNDSSDLEFFVSVLNQLLSRREIVDGEPFQSMINGGDKKLMELLGPETENPLLEMKEQLDRTFDPDLLQRLNRLMIARVLGDATGEVQLEMLPLTIWKTSRFQSQSLGSTEGFMIWVKAGVIAGLALSCPWVFFQLWSFVAAGLYPTEQRYVYVFLPVSLMLFVAGVCLAFFFVFGPVLEFLFSFNARMGITPQPRINDWLSFVMLLPLGFGVAFQLPLVMLFANRIDLIAVESYVGQWRIAILAIFGLSMLLTPADPISMILLAVPLTLLYFLGIGLCYWLNRPKNPFAVAAQN